MKKFKIMMLSLLVVGAVGGVLAFKASKSFTYLCDDIPTCPDLRPIPALTSIFPGDPIADLYCTTDPDAIPRVCFTVSSND